MSCSNAGMTLKRPSRGAQTLLCSHPCSPLLSSCRYIQVRYHRLQSARQLSPSIDLPSPSARLHVTAFTSAKPSHSLSLSRLFKYPAATSRIATPYYTLLQIPSHFPLPPSRPLAIPAPRPTSSPCLMMTIAPVAHREGPPPMTLSPALTIR